MYEAVLLEDPMATTTADIHNSPSAPLVSSNSMERLEELAEKHGWTLDGALKRALDLTEVVMESPDSKVYVYRDGKRYSLQVKN